MPKWHNIGADIVFKSSGSGKIKAAIAMNLNNRRPFAAGGRPGEKAVNDFFAAAMRGVHGDDSFSHGVAPNLRR